MSARGIMGYQGGSFVILSAYKLNYSFFITSSKDFTEGGDWAQEQGHCR